MSNITDISEKLNDKKKVSAAVPEEFGDGIVHITPDTKLPELDGKTIYPVAMFANMRLRLHESTYRLDAGGYVNLTEEERVKWNELGRLMKRPKDYTPPTAEDLTGCPPQAYQMLADEKLNEDLL